VWAVVLVTVYAAVFACRGGAAALVRWWWWRVARVAGKAGRDPRDEEAGLLGGLG
jgi:hypothetical protein